MRANRISSIVAGLAACLACAHAFAQSAPGSVQVLSGPVLPVATVGRQYYYAFTASGGRAPYEWRVESGALPEGLRMARSGEVIGAPAVPGAASVTVVATDATGVSATREAVLKVTPANETLKITTFLTARTNVPGLCQPPAEEKFFLTSDRQVVGYAGAGANSPGDEGRLEWLDPNGDVYSPFSWTAAAVGFCRAVTLSVSGFPPAQRPGEWRFRLLWNESEVAAANFAISPPPPAGAVSLITNSLLPQGTLGRPYTMSLTAAGAAPPFSFSVVAGALPPGLALSPAGAIAGEPSETGGYNFAVRVQDAAGNEDSRSFGLAVSRPALSFDKGSLAFSVVKGGTAALQTLAVGSTGSPLAFTAVSSGGPWLSVSPARGGTPAVLSVAVNAGSLEPGVYRRDIQFSAPLATPPSFALPVTLTVEPDAPPAQLRELIHTYAGNDWVFNTAGGPALEATLGRIRWLTVDAQGNLIVSDPDNDVVIRVRSNGQYETIAGNGIRGFAGDGGLATSASMVEPRGVVVDQHGNLYIADSGNSRIRRVSPDGVITTFAGTSVAGFDGDGGPATAAQFRAPSSLAIDKSGNLYVSDHQNYRIRKITANGVITTIAGTGENASRGDGGPAASAAVTPSAEGSLAVDAEGNLYIAEGPSRRLRRITPDGRIATVAGTGVANNTGDGGPASQAALDSPRGVAVDPSGNVYITVIGSAVRRIDTKGTITRFAGQYGKLGYSGDGKRALDGELATPAGLAADTAGNLYVADMNNFRVRRVAPDGILTTTAGNGANREHLANTLADAYFNFPRGIGLDPAGNLIVADSNACRVRRVGRDGSFTTIAGTGRSSFGGDGGPASLAAFGSLFGVAVDPSGNVFASDYSNNRVRRISTAGIVTTYAGNGTNAGPTGDNGPAASASLFQPWGLAFDAAGNLYIAEGGRHLVRRVDRATGAITTVAGIAWNAASTGDGGPATQAALNTPRALAFDRAGNLLVAEANGNVVRRIARDGTITRIAGTGRNASTGDGGPAIEASLGGPAGLALDEAGNIYVSEWNTHRVRRITPDGRIHTLAGTGTPSFSGDGGPAMNAGLWQPSGLAVDTSGAIYIADARNHRIRAVRALPVTLQSSAARLTFRANSDSGAAESQTARVSASSFGLPFSTSLRTETGGAWLKVSPATGLLPANLSVTADPAGLKPGSYTGYVSVLAANAAPLTISITFAVAEGAPSRLDFDPAQLTFSVPERGSADQVLLVTNRGSGILNFHAESMDQWLTISPINSSAGSGVAGAARVTANVSGLAAGPYRGAIVLSNESSAERTVVPVSLEVTPRGGPRILLSQRALEFQLREGGAEFPQCVAVLNTGEGALDFRVSTTASWLIASRTPCLYRAVSPANAAPEIEVGVNPDGLRAGEYRAEVVITAAGASNSPQTLPVRVIVLAPNRQLGPELRPTGLVFFAPASGNAPGSLDVTLLNYTGEKLDFSTAVTHVDGANWLTSQPSSGSAAPFLLKGPPPALRVQVQPAGLRPGLYTAYVTMGTRQFRTRDVQVLLALTPGSLDPASGERFSTGCTANGLTVVATGVPNDFAARVNANVPLEVFVMDDCARPFTGGSVIAAFSNGDPAISLTPLGDGRWTGTWTVTNPAAGPRVTLSVRAQSAYSLAQGFLLLTGTLE